MTYAHTSLHLSTPDFVLDQLVATEQLEEKHREKVREALLQRHTHGRHTKDTDKSSIFPHIPSIGDFTRHNSSKDMEKTSSHGSFFSRLTSRQNSHDSSRASERRGSLGSRDAIDVNGTNNKNGAEEHTTKVRVCVSCRGSCVHVKWLTTVHCLVLSTLLLHAFLFLHCSTMSTS